MMLSEVKHLAQMRLEYHKALRQFENDSRLTDSFITPFKLRFEMAVVDAILASHGMSDQFQIVVAMLTPKEIGQFICWGATYRKGRMLNGRTQGAA